MNVAVTTAAEGFPRRAFTVDDIGRMIEAGIIGEDERFELIEGEIVMMASRGIAHERIKSALLIAVARNLPDDLTMGVEVTLRLTDTVMLEPDIAVFPKTLFRKSSTGFARLDPGEACLIIEVVLSSLAYDKGLLGTALCTPPSQRVLGHRRQRAHHFRAHRRKRRRMVARLEIRAAGHAQSFGGAGLFDQAR